MLRALLLEVCICPTQRPRSSPLGHLGQLRGPGRAGQAVPSADRAYSPGKVMPQAHRPLATPPAPALPAEVSLRPAAAAAVAEAVAVTAAAAVVPVAAAMAVVTAAGAKPLRRTPLLRVALGAPAHRMVTMQIPTATTGAHRPKNPTQQAGRSEAGSWVT